MNEKQSVLSLDEIYRAASAMRDKINAIKVRYDFDQAPTEAEKELSSFTPVRNQRRMFAMKEYLRGAEVDGIEGGAPIHQRYVFDGNHMAFSRDNGRVLRSNVGRMDNKFVMSSIDQWQPYCLMADIPFANNIRHGWNFPGALLLSNFPFYVRETQERIDGRWCHVLAHPQHAHRTIEGIGDGEPVEFIWVDSNNPATMLKRERAYSLDGKYFPRERRMFSSFREVGKDVWLPMRAEWHNFPIPAENARQKELPTSIATCMVSEVKLNEEVSDEDFEFCIRNGEEFCFHSELPVPASAPAEASGPILTISKARDVDRTIAMPFDQPANQAIKQLIAEQDPGFF